MKWALYNGFVNRALLLALVTAPVLVGCKSDKPKEVKPEAVAPAAEPVSALPSVEVAKFDRACTAATDCVLVKAAMCEPCGCAVDAIASTEMAKFDEVASKLDCGQPDLDKMKCEPCAKRVATCEAGACVVAK